MEPQVHAKRTALDPAAVISDIEDLIAVLPSDCAPVAVHKYLHRLLESMQPRTGFPANPIRTAGLLASDAYLLAAAFTGWDGDIAELLSALGRTTEALAESIGAAADIAIHHASHPSAPQAWEDLADQAAGAYDAMISATTLLTSQQPCIKVGVVAS